LIVAWVCQMRGLNDLKEWPGKEISLNLNRRIEDHWFNVLSALVGIRFYHSHDATAP
jgi:hypothetical protein